MSQAKLFSPIRIGDLTLSHRVVMAPLGRLRATAQNVSTPLMAEYYAQRASTPGTFIIALHYKGRDKAILEMDLNIDDLLEKVSMMCMMIPSEAD